MDTERNPDVPDPPSAPPAELLTAADTTPELAAAYAEWLRDRAGDRP
jgi:hypothetical protein